MSWSFLGLGIESSRSALTPRATHQPSDPQLAPRQDIPRLGGKAKTGGAAIHRSTQKGDERVKGQRKRGTQRGRGDSRRWSTEQFHYCLSFFVSFVVYGLSPDFASSSVSHTVFSGCTNLQRPASRHGGSQRCQVDVSARLPSLCLPHSLHNKTRSDTHTHSRSKNANGADGSGRYEEGNYTGCQAPSARRRPERTEGRTNKRLIHPPSWPPPPRSLTLHSFRMSLCLFLPLSILPLCQIKAVKMVEKPNEPPHWKPSKCF